MTADTPAGGRAHGRLQETLESGRFAVTYELSPPRGASVNGIRRSARILKDVIDAANVTDGQSAMARVASWAGCIAAMQEGLEPIMQLQCRDRNRIALQADLLGAAAVRIPNVTLMTGDHQRYGDHPDAKGVFDLDSVQLIWTAHNLRENKLMLSGRTLTSAPHWFIGCVENPFAAPQAFRAERLGKKVEAGAEYVQTQYVFDVPGFKRWMEQVRDLGLDKRCYVLAGVGPIRSRRALDYLTKELSGVYVPDETSRRLLGVPEERMAEEAMTLCAETIQELHETPGVAGIHILAAGWEQRLPELLKRAGIVREPSGTPQRSEA